MELDGLSGSLRFRKTGSDGSLNGLKLSSDLRPFRMDFGLSWQLSTNSSSVLTVDRFFRMDRIFSPSQDRSSRLP